MNCLSFRGGVVATDSPFLERSGPYIPGTVVRPGNAAQRTRSTGELEWETFVSAIVASLVASLGAGAVLHATGRMGSVAALYGLEGTAAGWLLVLVHCLVAGIFFIGVVTVLSRVGPGFLGSLEDILGAAPVTTLVGGVYGVGLWVVGVALLVPVWMRVMISVVRPVPYLHRPSFLGAVVFGGLLGVSFGLTFGVGFGSRVFSDDGLEW